MKKLLALVLALVMTMGLATISTNAAFTDSKEISHTEAVEVLNALGVIAGMPDGSFDPNGNVTRAQMAKMITIIMLGADTDPSAFTGAVTNLNDINGHWAEGYIKYCVSQGIVVGKGDGKFYPDANVTSAEAAKMLLTALGYNASVQGYTGSDWSIHVVRDASNKKLYEDVTGVTTNQTLNREIAAQMIWNTIQAGTIIKNASQTRDSDGKITDTYEDTDKRLLNGAVAPITLLNETFNGWTIEEGYLSAIDYDNARGEYVYTIELVGGHTTQNKTAVAGGAMGNLRSTTDYSDLFGMKVHVIWHVKDSRNLLYGIYPDGGATILETTTLDGVDVKAQGSTNCTIKANGTTYNTDTQGIGNGAWSNFVPVRDVGNIVPTYGLEFSDISANHNGYGVTKTAALNTNGNAVGGYYKANLIDNNGNGSVDLVVYYPVEIAKVNYASSSSVSLVNDYLAAGSPASYSYNNDANQIDEGLAKDDYVVITRANFSANGKNIVQKLDTTIEGTINGIDSFNTGDGGAEPNRALKVIVDGDKYIITRRGVFGTALNTNDNVGTGAIGNTMKAAVYGGFIFDVNAKSKSGTEKFAIVVATDAKGALGEHAEAKLLFADGTKKVVSTATNYSATGLNYAAGTLVVIREDDEVYQLVNATGAGVIGVNAAGDLVANFPALAKGAAGATKTFDADTVLLDFDNGIPNDTYNRTGAGSNNGLTGRGYSIDDDAVVFRMDDGQWKVTTGSNLKRTAAAAALALDYEVIKKDDATGFRSIKLVKVNAGSAVNASDKNFAVITSGVSSVKNSDGDTVYSFTMWNGENKLSVTTTNKTTGTIRETAGGRAVTLAKGVAIEYTDDSEGVIKVDHAFDLDLTKTVLTPTTGTYGNTYALKESAIISYASTTKNGEYNIGLANGVLSYQNGVTDKIVGAVVTRSIDNDTVVIYIDRDGGDWNDIAGGSVRLATETSTDGTYFANAAYLDRGATGYLDLLIVEIDNNWNDGAME